MVMYETIQASFYLKNSISFPFVKIKGDRRRASGNLSVFSTVERFAFLRMKGLRA